MNKTLLLASAAACMALAGCLGGGDGGSGAQATETYDRIEAGIDDGSITTVSDMPTGQASMSGHIGVADVGEDGDLTAIGALALDVDFDGGTVTGSASDFGLYNSDSGNKTENITGTLDVAGTLSGSTMTADASGELSDGETPSDVALTMTGDFYDDGGDLLVYGDVSGTIADAADGGDSQTVEGGFYAYED
ncbi:MAG: hypothetical protein AB7U46_13770 [Paenirhodobacter sp.]|uniref:hypothetical protein n=1 Tax=Paenirhodobacter sp. TaxID=1965326 RepID=UPI003D139D25